MLICADMIAQHICAFKDCGIYCNHIWGGSINSGTPKWMVDGDGEREKEREREKKWMVYDGKSY